MKPNGWHRIRIETSDGECVEKASIESIADRQPLSESYTIDLGTSLACVGEKVDFGLSTYATAIIQLIGNVGAEDGSPEAAMQDACEAFIEAQKSKWSEHRARLGFSPGEKLTIKDRA